MSTITIDGLNEEEFRRSIERKLRHDQANEAAQRLRELLAPYAADGRILPERFLSVDASDIVINGWDALGDSLRRHDRPGRPISALSIAFAWPGDEVPQPDADGRLSPVVEVSYYTDDAFPFSQSGRDDLLDGYSFHGCTWADDCEATDRSLYVGGIDDLHGALALLEARLLASEEPDEEEISAGSLGACLLSVLFHQAVKDRIACDGLPRPLCVMAGSNGVYPYFDAPVAGMPEDARRAAALAEEEGTPLDTGVPGPRYSSLLVTGIPRAQKRAVLVLEETAEESAVRIASLRGLAPAEVQAEPAGHEMAAASEPQPAETAIAPVPSSPLLTKKPAERPIMQTYDPREVFANSGSDDEDDWEDLPAASVSGPPRDAEPIEWRAHDESDSVPAWDEQAAPDGEPEEEPLLLEESQIEQEAEPQQLEQAAHTAEVVPFPREEPVAVAAAEDDAVLELEDEILADVEPVRALSAAGAGGGGTGYAASAVPGFSLFDRALEGRLRPAAPEGEPERPERFEPAPFAPKTDWVEELIPFDVAAEKAAAESAEPAPAGAAAEQEAAPDPFRLVEPAAPVWPLGIGWLEDIAAEAEQRAAVSPAGANPAKGDIFSLWARLRGWLTRGR